MAKPRPCHVSLTFVSNDDVLQHINDIDGVAMSGKKTKSAPAPVQTLHLTPARPKRSTRKEVNYKETEINISKPRSSSSSSSSSSEEEDGEEDNESEDEDEDEENLNPNPEVLLGQQDSVAGNEVYQFKTPKRSGQMAQLASQTITPLSISVKKTALSVAKKTPASSRKAQPTKTPATSTRKRTARGDATTPASSVTAKTQNLRRSTRKRKPVLPESDEESEYSPESSSDEDDDEDAESRREAPSDDDSDDQSTSSKDSRGGKGRGRGRGGKVPMKGKAVTNGRTPARPGRRRARGDVEVANMAEEYFEAHSGGVMTSDHTLSRLETPQMDSQQLHSTLAGMTNNYASEISELYEEYCSNFKKWMFHLSNGFNLLFYGLGSKRNLLEKFRVSCLADWPQLVINGFFPSLTIKSVCLWISSELTILNLSEGKLILNSISDEILERDSAFRNLTEQMEFIEEILEENEDELFLIIHNIDGMMLRGSKVQSVLSSLAQIPSVHIVASIDHINAPLIWDQARASSFNWLWYDATTFDPYVEETSYENSLLVQQSGVLALSSLTHVLRSLTPNARGIFNLLVQYQLEHKDDAAYNGLSFHELYQKCREAFLVNSDLTLRAQLTEFRDHKLVRSRKGLDGIELLYIPVDNATLQEFLQQEDL